MIAIAMLSVASLAISGSQAISFSKLGKPSSCWIYSDPILKKFAGPDQVEREMPSGGQLMSQECRCPHIPTKYAVYAVIGSPTYSDEGLTAVGAVVQVGDTVFGMNRDGFAYSDGVGWQKGQPFTIPGSPDNEKVTVSSCQHPSNQNDGLCLSAANMNLEVKVHPWLFKTSLTGRVEVWEPFTTVMCGCGLCHMTERPSFGASSKASSSTRPHIPSNVASMMRRVQASLRVPPPRSKLGGRELPTAELLSGRPGPEKTPSTSEAMRVTAVITDSNGPFKACHNDKAWNSAVEQRRAANLLVTFGISQETTCAVLKGAAANCAAFAGGQQSINLRGHC